VTSDIPSVTARTHWGHKMTTTNSARYLLTTAQALRLMIILTAAVFVAGSTVLLVLVSR
jgi:hypothetical protein